MSWRSKCENCSRVRLCSVVDVDAGAVAEGAREEQGLPYKPFETAVIRLMLCRQCVGEFGRAGALPLAGRR